MTQTHCIQRLLQKLQLCLSPPGVTANLCT